MNPFAVTWTGTGFDVLYRDAKRADAELVIGQRYGVEVIEERSEASHKQFFAAVNEIWKNLPDDLAAEFPSAEALRKRALIVAGFRDERTIACSSRAEALRLAAFIRPMDDFALVVVSGSLVSVYTAQSQSKKAMGKERWEASKVAVFDKLAEMIGTSREAVETRAAEIAA